MKAILGLCLAAMLVGCATEKQLVDQPVVIKYKYVISTIPDEMLTVPPPEQPLDPNTATDKDAAKWLVAWEKRYQEIERRLKAIADYQIQRLKELKIPPEDVVK